MTLDDLARDPVRAGLLSLRQDCEAIAAYLRSKGIADPRMLRKGLSTGAPDMTA